MPKKKKKLSNSFCEIKLLSEKLTTDGQTDRQTDRQTDNSTDNRETF